MAKRLQGLIAGIIIGLVIAGSVAVAATRTIEVSYNNIKLYVDGNLISPKDATGKIVEPFVYEGTTYLPVRALGEALGKNVDWDGTTASVYIGARPGSVEYLGEGLKPYSKSGGYYEYPDKGSFKIAGNVYYRGAVARNNNEHALYNTDAKYTQLSGIYGPTDTMASSGNGTISFYGDDRLIKTLEIKYGDLPKDFTVDLQGVLQLKIEFSRAYLAIADVQIKG